MKDSIKYVLQRVLFIFLTAFIILSLTYILIQCLPVDETGASTDTMRLQLYTQLVNEGVFYRVTDNDAILAGHYDKSLKIGAATYYFGEYPVLHRYWAWLVRIVTKFDWGSSTNLTPGMAATEIIMNRLPYSMRLNIISIFISIPLGIGLGILAALKKNTWVDATISTIIMIFISVPSFVLISFIIILFGKINGWPLYWPSDANAAADPAMAFKAYVIPVMALCFGSVCSFARYTRAELTEVMSSEFLLLARTKGLTKSQAVVRHALRNSMVPIVPMIISEFVGILSGSMVLEQIYRIPGLGSLFVEALTSKDYAVIMVDSAIYTTIGLFATLIIDLSYGIVDPRIRMGARK